MKTLVFLFVMTASCDLYGQSILDALRQPTQSAEIELLNQANQASQSTSNALAKRASLLQRRAEELRSQVDRLEIEVEKLRAENKALKMAVIDCRDQVVVLVELLEKQDFSAIAAPLEKLRAAYTKSLLPKLLTKEPVAETEPTLEAPVVLNPPTPQPATPQPATPKPTAPQSEKAPDK